MSKAKANNITPAGIILSGAVLADAPHVSSTHVTQSTSVQAAPPPTTRPAETGKASAINNTDTANSFFINPTFQSDSIAGSDPRAFYQKSLLLKLAEIAYSRRDLAGLELIAAQLLSLPDEHAKSAGLYYLAIVAKRRGDTEQAVSLLRSIQQAPIIQAKAIQTLGAIEFEAGRYENALPLFIRAAQVAKGIDVATSLNALYQVSAIKSISGDHRQALDDLLSLWPIVRSVINTHPHLYFNWHNDTAFELMHVGRIEEARAALSVAFAWPAAKNYPEYQETKTEIERHECKKIIITVQSLPKTVIAFRLSFLVKRRVITSRRIRLPIITRAILDRVKACAPDHAPPFKVK